MLFAVFEQALREGIGVVGALAAVAAAAVVAAAAYYEPWDLAAAAAGHSLAWIGSRLEPYTPRWLHVSRLWRRADSAELERRDAERREAVDARLPRL